MTRTLALLTGALAAGKEKLDKKVFEKLVDALCYQDADGKPCGNPEQVFPIVNSLFARVFHPGNGRTELAKCSATEFKNPSKELIVNALAEKMETTTNGGEHKLDVGDTDAYVLDMAQAQWDQLLKKATTSEQGSQSKAQIEKHAQKAADQFAEAFVKKVRNITIKVQSELDTYTAYPDKEALKKVTVDTVQNLTFYKAGRAGIQNSVVTGLFNQITGDSLVGKIGDDSDVGISQDVAIQNEQLKTLLKTIPIQVHNEATKEVPEAHIGSGLMQSFKTFLGNVFAGLVVGAIFVGLVYSGVLPLANGSNVQGGETKDSQVQNATD